MEISPPAVPGASLPDIDTPALVIDMDARKVTVGKKKIVLSPKEFDLLYLLARNPERVISRSSLIENTSEPGAEPLARTLDSHIRNLRKKLGKASDWIETSPKVGYSFHPPQK